MGVSLDLGYLLKAIEFSGNQQTHTVHVVQLVPSQPIHGREKWWCMLLLDVRFRLGKNYKGCEMLVLEFRGWPKSPASMCTSSDWRDSQERAITPSCPPEWNPEPVKFGTKSTVTRPCSSCSFPTWLFVLLARERNLEVSNSMKGIGQGSTCTCWKAEIV